jgi:hypothetical protein
MRTARDFITINCPSNPTTHAEIESRYAESRRKALKKRGPPPMGLLRINELERIFTDRWGEHDLPDSPEGRDAIAILCNHCALLKDLGRLYAFVAARARWMREGELAAIIERESGNAPGGGPGLGWRLGLTIEDRTRLRIRTIRAIGVTDHQIKNLRKAADRERKADRRRADQAKPRADHEADSLARTKPWEALGLSRRTWYRRGRPSPGGTGPSAVPCLAVTADEHVPLASPSSPSPIEKGAAPQAEAEGKPASACEPLERSLARASRPSGTAVSTAVLIDVRAVDAEARAFRACWGRAPTVDECLAIIDAGVGRHVSTASPQT